MDVHVADFQSPHGLAIVEKRTLAKAEIGVFCPVELKQPSIQYQAAGNEWLLMHDDE